MTSLPFVRSDIMIVDDDPSNLKLLEEMLRLKGHEVHAFPLGRLALAAAHRNPPDLILLDINMPEMDGYEVCERLKSATALAAIPVIFLSALNGTEDKVHAFRIGAADYISKPFQFEEVHARVETHLELHRLQRGLRRQKEHLEESAADVIFRFDLYPQPHFSYLNAAVLSIAGYSPEEYYDDPNLMLRIVHSNHGPLMRSILDGDFISGSVITFEVTHRNGNSVWIEQRNTLVKDSSGRVIAIEGIGRDITERRNLEEQLRQSQKVEAMGLLAGGVAHDFNNKLTVILGYSNLILDDNELDVKIVEKIGQIRKAASQAAVLTRQLLAFGRRQTLRPSVLDLNTVIEDSSGILRRIIGEHVELVTALQAGLDFVRADAGQIDQILMNLVANSKDAMPQGGKIIIRTKNVTAVEARAAGGVDSPSGRCVLLSVSDTGGGMDASTAAQIFDPFFTTKELGKGTGLGLSIVHGIVKQSGGSIRVQTRPGQGADFEILFPRVEKPEGSAMVEPTRTEPPIGSETILLVEDDRSVRQLLKAILQRAGYEVLTAHNGHEALQVFEQYEDQIALVITDLIMPGMGGAALVQSLRRLSSGVRALYMSGYAGDETLRLSQIDAGTPFIEKPFTGVSLVEKVREILDGR